MALTGRAATCENGPCPTVYETDGGDFVVQGYITTETPSAMPPGEAAVLIPRDAWAKILGQFA